LRLGEAARIKRHRAAGERGGGIGGVEAAGTVTGALRRMYSWAMEAGKLKRKDNPASKIDRNLPKKKQGDVVPSLNEACLVWDAAEVTGYPIGTHVQLMLLTGCRRDARIRELLGLHYDNESLSRRPSHFAVRADPSPEPPVGPGGNHYLEDFDITPFRFLDRRALAKSSFPIRFRSNKQGP
jgi:hypothetical protein